MEKINSPKLEKQNSVVDFLKALNINSSFENRRRLFKELFPEKEEYNKQSKQNILLLSRLKLEYLKKDIPIKTTPTTNPSTKTEVAKNYNINNPPETWYQNKILSEAEKYKGCPYDTSKDNKDGFALSEWKRKWVAKLKNNFSWEIYESNKRPMVWVYSHSKKTLK